MKILITCFFLITSFAIAQQATVAEFNIIGHKKLRASFVKKISNIKAGVVLDSTMIKADIKLLKRLPSIANASYEVLSSGNNTYTVIYTVEENFTIIPSANVYTTNDDEFAYRLGLFEFNLFGRNMTFGGFYQQDIYRSYALNFRAPYLFSKQFGLAINYQDLTTQEPVFFDNTTSNYKYNNESFEVLGLYQLNYNNRFELGINVFTEDYEYKFGATNPNVPQDLQVNKLLYKLIYEYNNLDFNFQYVEGFSSVLNVQHVTSKSEDLLPTFTIGWNDFLYFKRYGSKGNWASRLRLGLSTNNDTPFAPFSVDNNLNIRGVGNSIDRGTAAVVLNTEYRHTLYEKGWFALQGNAFVDAGSWRQPGGHLDEITKFNSLRVYPGVGLRFIHKKIFNAIFRIDYGIGVSNNSTQGLVFGIGQYF
ncbi:BamA/TamA family outer membrane protein [Psychroserpens damuponensis]|uniref:outer membrane protein assembly factor n=1 Tax=Psychroserpens damuponensis TaxID=943936 RepID=UPI00058EAF00|nr:outer membrane protein assembly factor [Psychroserpens damuponensis]